MLLVEYDGAEIKLIKKVGEYCIDFAKDLDDDCSVEKGLSDEIICFDNKKNSYLDRWFQFQILLQFQTNE